MCFSVTFRNFRNVNPIAIQSTKYSKIQYIIICIYVLLINDVRDLQEVEI